MTKSLALIVLLAGCGGQVPPPEEPESDHGDTGLFVDRAFTPHAFTVHVTGKGRPVIFIPGLGCPGEVWDDTVAHLDDVEAHVLTLAGFAGQRPVKPPLAATVRKELVRYIRGNKLRAPIIIGHSLGGFIAYWLAATAPDLIGGVVVVDAGPSLSDTDVETGRALRNMWAQAGDDELPEQVRAAYTGMTSDPKRIEPFIAQIAKSDRQTMGDTIYELVTTDISDRVSQISAPLLLVLADGGLQQRYKAQVQPVPHHEIVVLPRTRHFVMFDDPQGFVRAIEKFLDTLP
jgi:pimeloyl-ACP methyl ester carboxylesterase